MTDRRPRLPAARWILAGFVLAALALPARAQDAPKIAGTDVPAPKRAKTVLPEYPPEAQAQGVRGIVILEVVIDTQGHVASAEVVRSIPALDEAALAAVRKWEYEVTKVDGKPVSVRLTVPITFALKVPEVARQEGIPELRQGAAPAFPPESARGGKGSATVTAEVTLDADGAVADALVTSGQAPWDEALLRAIRTWKFAVDDPGSTLAFKVEAEFVPGAKGEGGRVDLRLSNPRKSKSTTATADASAPPAPSQPPTSQPPAPPTTQPAPVPQPAAQPPAAQPPAAQPRAPQPPPTPPPTPAAPAPSAPTSPTPAAPAPNPDPGAAMPPTPSVPSAAPAPGAPTQASGPAVGAPSPKAAQPPVEMLSAPAPKPAPGPVENGVSAIREVALSPGVPDLVRGRRPVPPPFARMSGATGTVQVRFSVNAAGGTTVLAADGPEIFKPAAQEAVSSWSFRRASAERLHLVAAFDYQLDKASATVKVEEGQP